MYQAWDHILKAIGPWGQLRLAPFLPTGAGLFPICVYNRCNCEVVGLTLGRCAPEGKTVIISAYPNAYFPQQPSEHSRFPVRTKQNNDLYYYTIYEIIYIGIHPTDFRCALVNEYRKMYILDSVIIISFPSRTSA